MIKIKENLKKLSSIAQSNSVFFYPNNIALGVIF